MSRGCRSFFFELISSPDATSLRESPKNVIFPREGKRARDLCAAGRAPGASPYPGRGAREPAAATGQLPAPLILSTFVLASIRQQLRGSSPPAADLNSSRRPRGPPDPPSRRPQNHVSPCSSVTHVGREGATDHGFVSLHVVIGRFVTHFAVNVLIAFLLEEELQ